MSSKYMRKQGRTTSDVSTETTDFDSIDLDLFDQLANQPRKTTRGIRFRELPEEEELPETDLAEEEITDELEEDESGETDEEYEETQCEQDAEEDDEAEEEYIPVRARRSSVSRTPVARTTVSSRSTSRTPSRTSRATTTKSTARTSRVTSTVSGRRLSSGTEETGTSATPRTTGGRSMYGFPVRTTGSSTDSGRPADTSSSWSMSTIRGTGYQVSTDNLSDDASLSAPTSLSAEDLALLSPKSKKKNNSVLRFCRTIFIIVMIITGAWAIYGVSVESNLGFWQQTFKSEITYVHETFRSLPSPLLMMIDQP